MRKKHVFVVIVVVLCISTFLLYDTSCLKAHRHLNKSVKRMWKNLWYNVPIPYLYGRELELSLKSDSVSNEELNTTSFLYLIQTESCLPHHLGSSEAFENTSSCRCEVIVLSYKKACNENTLAHVEYLYGPSSSWNVGRNLLFSTAMKRNKKYLYYIFMDDDIILKSETESHVDENPWRIFETFLEEVEPAIANVDISPRNKLQCVYKGRKQQGCHLKEGGDYLPIAHFDQAFAAFHYRAVQHILPYTTKFDNICWWFSGWCTSIKSEVMFAGQSVVHTKLVAVNPKHRPYPRNSFIVNGTYYWPKMMKEAVADIPEIYRSVSLLLEWVERGPKQSRQSSALCLPPPSPHMPIKPFAYLEQK